MFESGAEVHTTSKTTVSGMIYTAIRLVVLYATFYPLGTITSSNVGCALWKWFKFVCLMRFQDTRNEKWVSVWHNSKVKRLFPWYWRATTSIGKVVTEIGERVVPWRHALTTRQFKHNFWWEIAFAFDFSVHQARRNPSCDLSMGGWNREPVKEKSPPHSHKLPQHRSTNWDKAEIGVRKTLLQLHLLRSSEDNSSTSKWWPSVNR